MLKTLIADNFSLLKKVCFKYNVLYFLHKNVQYYDILTPY